MSFSSNKIGFSRPRRVSLGLIIFFSLVLMALDRLSKWFVLDHPNLYESDLIKLELFKNPKLYFWAVNSVFLYIIMGAVSLLLIFLLIKTWHKQNFLLTTGLSLIILGGLSNLFDRIIFGYVIDWIRVFFLPISIFNIADIMIMGGLVCILIKFLKLKQFT